MEQRGDSNDYRDEQVIWRRLSSFYRTAVQTVGNFSQCLLQPAERDSLLFKTHPISQKAVLELLEQDLFGNGQSAERPLVTVALAAPELTMGHQGRTVHQKRLGIREEGAQAIENGEAMCVDIAPIIERLRSEPRSLGKADKPWRSIRRSRRRNRTKGGLDASP